MLTGGAETAGGGGGCLGGAGLGGNGLFGGGGGGIASPPVLDGPIFSFSASGLKKKKLVKFNPFRQQQ